MFNLNWTCIWLFYCMSSYVILLLQISVANGRYSVGSSTSSDVSNDSRTLANNPASKYQRTTAYTNNNPPGNIIPLNHATPKQNYNPSKSKQSFNSLKSGSLLKSGDYPIIGHGYSTTTTTSTTESTLSTSSTIYDHRPVAGPSIPIHSNHHSMSGLKVPSSGHHHPNHHHQINESCPHTYPFPPVEGALLSNSMKGLGYCSSIESGYTVHKEITRAIDEKKPFLMGE